jgi:hypothetical protein
MRLVLQVFISGLMAGQPSHESSGVMLAYIINLPCAE